MLLQQFDCHFVSDTVRIAETLTIKLKALIFWSTSKTLHSPVFLEML